MLASGGEAVPGGSAQTGGFASPTCMRTMFEGAPDVRLSLALGRIHNAGGTYAPSHRHSGVVRRNRDRRGSI
eukprot:8228309-Pyramimonas_sp.AAC.1